MIAANIMRKEVITLGMDGKALDALKLIRDERIGLIPVVDRERKVLGVITPRGLMNAILPGHGTDGLLEDVRSAPDLPKFIENMEALAAKGIGEVLDKDYASVSPETSSMEVATLFVKAKRPPDSILVLDPQKRLLGIISTGDLFRMVLEFDERKNR